MSALFTQTTASDTLQQIVACSRELYTLPRVAMKVLELTDRENVDIPALRRCIEHDPALTTKVLRVVNSSLFGLPRQVADLNHALTLLGVKPLKMLVLGFSLPPDLFEGMENELLQQYWRRATIKAVAAREIAHRWGRVDSEELLIGGLLQDIGILVLLQQLGHPYARFVKQLWEAGNQLTLQERELFGFDHTEITSRLLNAWRLPPQLASAVRAPDMLSLALPPATTVLWMAELTTAFLTSGDAEQLAALYQSLATWKHVPAEQVEAFLIDLQVQVEQLANAFSVEATSAADYAELIGNARNRLANESESLSDLLAIQAREVKVDREQWIDLIDALENMPAGQQLPSHVVEAADADVESDLHCTAPVAAEVASLAALPRRTSHIAPVLQRVEPRPLTDDTVFVRQVAHAVANCRAQRHGLSLMLIEIDRAEELMLTRGVASLAQARDDAESWLANSLHLERKAIPLGDHCFAFLLPAVDRVAASSLARQMVDEAVSPPTTELEIPSGASLSIGIATIALPPKNFPAHDLVEAAQRCLEAAKRSGGGTSKSIEIY